jgi:hypothetical protein
MLIAFFTVLFTHDPCKDPPELGLVFGSVGFAAPAFIASSKIKTGGTGQV